MFVLFLCLLLLRERNLVHTPLRILCQTSEQVFLLLNCKLRFSAVPMSSSLLCTSAQTCAKTDYFPMPTLEGGTCYRFRGYVTTMFLPPRGHGQALVELIGRNTFLFPVSVAPQCGHQLGAKGQEWRDAPMHRCGPKVGQVTNHATTELGEDFFKKCSWQDYAIV